MTGYNWSDGVNLDSAINIEDLHRIAKRKLPRIIFDYIEGGVEDERGLTRNEARILQSPAPLVTAQTRRIPAVRRQSGEFVGFAPQSYRSSCGPSGWLIVTRSLNSRPGDFAVRKRTVRVTNHAKGAHRFSLAPCRGRSI